MEHDFDVIGKRLVENTGEGHNIWHVGIVHNNSGVEVNTGHQCTVLEIEHGCASDKDFLICVGVHEKGLISMGMIVTIR